MVVDVVQYISADAQVHLCELIAVDDDATNERDLLSSSSSRTTFVAVRMFSQDLCISARY